MAVLFLFYYLYDNCQVKTNPFYQTSDALQRIEPYDSGRRPELQSGGYVRQLLQQFHEKSDITALFDCMISGGTLYNMFKGRK